VNGAVRSETEDERGVPAIESQASDISIRDATVDLPSGTFKELTRRRILKEVEGGCDDWCSDNNDYFDIIVAMD